MALEVYTDAEIERMYQKGEAAPIHRYLVLVPKGETSNPGTIHANIQLANEKAEAVSKENPGSDILILESNAIPRTIDGKELRTAEKWTLVNVIKGGEKRVFSNTIQDMIMGFED